MFLKWMLFVRKLSNFSDEDKHCSFLQEDGFAEEEFLVKYKN